MESKPSRAFLYVEKGRLEMKLREADKTIERNILTGFIVSTDFTVRVSQWMEETYLDGHGARTILRWCRQYHEKYGKAIFSDIQNRFITALKDNELDEDEAEYVSNLLASLSGNFERRTSQFNVEYHVEVAEKFCRTKHLEQISQSIQSYISQGRIEDAEACVKEFAPLSKDTQTWCKPFEDKEGLIRALSSQQEPIVFRLRGELGKFLNPQLYRGAFISFLAPEKRGKSYLLQELALQAYLQGCNVAFFECGDMSEAQRKIRLCQYISQLPYRRDVKPGEIIEVRFPLDFEGNTEIRELRNLNADDTAASLDKWLSRKHVKSQNKGDFRLSCHSNDTLTAKEMRRILEQWNKEDGFVPDLIVDDYLDIHAAEDSRKDFRHQDNQKWTNARTLNLDYNCVYVTATQADADSYDKESLGMKNFSENKRKYAHVTAMYALNQTKDEKLMNIIRIGDIGVVREGAAQSQVQILQCLEIGRPYIDSRVWKKSRTKRAEDFDEVEDELKPLNKTELARKLLGEGMSPTDIVKQHGLSYQIITQAKKKLG